ncbi:MAG TPA: hypothetical protein VKT32_01885 [Chthonomonadaceae bacterium]|nr:hypothetical protein [Chthonomonadaceae bacterium]
MDTQETPITTTPDIAPRPERRATLRFRQREMSRLSLAISLLVIVGLVFAGYRLFLNFKSQRDIVIGKNNLRMLYQAAKLYAMDHDGHLPPAPAWTDSIAGYLSAPPGTPGGPESYLHGPGDEAVVGYAYNDLAGDYNLDPNGKEAEKQLPDDQLPLFIEMPNAPRNAHLSIPAQDSEQGEAALAKVLAFPHYASDPKNATTLLMMTNGSLETITRQDLSK